MPDENCKHLNATVGLANTIAHATCPDCHREVNLAFVFNNWLDEFKAWRKCSR